MPLKYIFTFKEDLFKLYNAAPLWLNDQEAAVDFPLLEN